MIHKAFSADILFLCMYWFFWWNFRQSQCEGVGAWSRRRADRRSSKEPNHVSSATKLCSTPEPRLIPSTPVGSRKRSAPSSQSTGESKRTKRTSINLSVQDCVAHRTRSRKSNSDTSLVDTPISTLFSRLSKSVDIEPAAPQSSSSIYKAGCHLEGSLFPLEDRDFDYSPFSASTATDIVDSDHSLYTPTHSKSKKRGRKARSSTLHSVNKKVRYNGSLTDKFAVTSTPTATKLHLSLPSVSSTNPSGHRGPVARPSLIPRRVPSSVQNRTYPLRSRGANLLSNSVANQRDSSGNYFAHFSKFIVWLSCWL